MRPLPAIVMTLALTGCSVDRSTDVPTSPTRRPEALPAATPPATRPIALVDRDPVTLLDLRERLLEAAGGEVIREVRLEHALRDRLEAEGIELDEADIEAEEIRLLAELDDDPDIARRLLQVVQNAEGLGKTRYHGLLWRNAALRALVQPDVLVDAEAMQLVWEITHGPQVRVRVIVVASYSRAASLVEQLNDGKDFTRLAVDWSIDASRDRGGLLDPFSTVDPSFPTALRQSVDALGPGEHTNPVLLGDRYLVARLEERIPADGVTYETLEPELHDRARQSQERMLMQEEAYRLRNEPDMRLFDGALEASFKATDPERAAP